MSFAGRTLYHTWHRPKGWLQDLIADGGPWERKRTQLGREAMRQAAHQLKPDQTTKSGLPLTVHFLTGERFWDMSAFCLRSLQQHSEHPVQAVVYDDGTLSAATGEFLCALAPGSKIVPLSATQERLESLLPGDRFPVLRDRWLHYPNIRKLTDPHLGVDGWKLVIDSDLLFFRRPTFLLDWTARSDRPLHAVDCQTSYGYSRPLLERLAGRPLAERLNVGLCGLQGETLDWERIEWICRELINAEGTNYYLEQAVVAVLLAGQDCAVAPADDYITLPRPPEVNACQAVMHHYVANSKRWYFQHNWRRVLQSMD
ncbi:MAG: hypothetical protein R3F03_04345 [Opitutaceae bacterium]